MDVLLLRVFAPVGMSLPSRCLAMGIHVTIHSTYYRFTGQALFINLPNSFDLFKDRNVKGVSMRKLRYQVCTSPFVMSRSYSTCAPVLLIMPSFNCCMADCLQYFNAVWSELQRREAIMHTQGVLQEPP
jgi:hypothetical protein